MSYDLYFWRRKPDCSLSDARIFALLSEDLEVPDLASLGAERVAARLDDAFPGWRSDEQEEVRETENAERWSQEFAELRR